MHRSRQSVQEVAAMTLMQRPTGGSLSLRDAVERLIEEPLGRPLLQRELASEIAPPIDLLTTPEAVIANVALPGVRAEDVDVSISDDQVTVSGTFQEAVEGGEVGYEQRELRHGAFSRRFTVPQQVRAAAASATFRDGLLTITLPRAEEAKARHIKILPSGTGDESIVQAKDLGSPGGPVLPR
jgi:HSP20 family protein